MSVQVGEKKANVYTGTSSLGKRQDDMETSLARSNYSPGAIWDSADTEILIQINFQRSKLNFEFSTTHFKTNLTDTTMPPKWLCLDEIFNRILKNGPRSVTGGSRTRRLKYEEWNQKHDNKDLISTATPTSLYWNTKRLSISHA